MAITAVSIITMFIVTFEGSTFIGKAWIEIGRDQVPEDSHGHVFSQVHYQLTTITSPLSHRIKGSLGAPFDRIESVRDIVNTSRRLGNLAND